MPLHSRAWHSAKSFQTVFFGDSALLGRWEGAGRKRNRKYAWKVKLRGGLPCKIYVNKLYHNNT